METLFEFSVATYLTRGGKVFIAPQFSVPGDRAGSEWSCPDIVALSFESPNRSAVLIVEVFTGSDVAAILKKVNDRKSQWFDRLRKKLTDDGIIDDGWPIWFRGFVRRQLVDKANAAFAGEDDVRFTAIEDATFPWEYWDQRASSAV